MNPSVEKKDLKKWQYESYTEQLKHDRQMHDRQIHDRQLRKDIKTLNTIYEQDDVVKTEYDAMLKRDELRQRKLNATLKIG